MRARTRAHYQQLRVQAARQRTRAAYAAKARARTRTAYARGQGAGQRLRRVHGTASVGYRTVSPIDEATRFLGQQIRNVAGGGLPPPPGASRRPGGRYEAAIHVPVVGGPTSALGIITKQTAAHPVKTLKGLGYIASSIPAAVGELALNTATGAIHGHPEQGFAQIYKQAKKDYPRRYSGILSGSEAGRRQFEQRLAKEGTSAEVADIATFAVPAGAVVGRGVGALARTGALGERATRIATAPRPALRLAGGSTADALRPQTTAPNFFRAAAQRGQDVARQRAFARRVRQLETKGKPVRGLVPRQGEVVRATLGGQRRSQRYMVSRTGSKGYSRQRFVQEPVLNKGAEPNLRRLASHQQRNIAPPLQGLVNLDDKRVALRQLKDQRAAILARRFERTPEPLRATAQTFNKSHDEVRVLDELIDDLQHNRGKIFNQHLKEVQAAEAARSIDVERQLVEKTGGSAIGAMTAEARRLAPIGERYGVAGRWTAEDAAHFDRTLKAVKADEEAGRITPIEATAQRTALHQARAEHHQKYIGAVRRKMEREGLPEPAFFPHDERTGAGFAYRTPGSGLKAPAGFKKSDMERLAIGSYEQGTQPYLRGLARSTKLPAAWHLTDEQARNIIHEIPHGELQRVLERKINPRKVTANDLLAFVERSGMDPRDWGVYHPGRLGKDATQETGNLHSLLGDEESHAVGAGVADAAALFERGSSVRAPGGVRDLSVPSEETARFLTEPGAKLAPRAALEELMATTRPSGLGGRMAQKLMGGQSALMLGTSPSWELMQVAANALASGVGGVGPVSWVQAQRFFHKILTPAERLEWDEAIGTVGVGQAHARRTYLGSTAPRSIATLSDAFGKTRFGQVVRRHGSKANPISWLFGLDNLQTTAFKRAVLYSGLRRQMFKRIGENAGKSQMYASRISNILRLPPKDQMRFVMNNRAVFEGQARHTLNLMGDWTRYTAFERKFLKRFVLFYGFLRYSLRMALYTMPVQHPIMGSLLAKLGQLHVDEVKDLLGGDEVPWAFSRVFINKNGKLESVDLARINPFVNSLTQAISEGPKALIGLMSPIGAGLLSQVADKDIWSGMGYRVHGSASEAKPEDLDLVTRVRVFLNEQFSSYLPYRVGMQAAYPGQEQGADALLGSPRPIHPKTPEAQAKQARRLAAQPRSASEALTRNIFPFIPRPDYTREQAVERRKKKGGPTAKKKTSDPYGLGEFSGAGAGGGGGGKAKSDPYGLGGF